MKSLSSAAAVLAVLPLTLAGPQHYGRSQSCTALTADEISSMGNNSLFTRWRPYSHFNAPAGWMNDPCGGMYDPIQVGIQRYNVSPRYAEAYDDI